ncbi:hypothetical protein ABE28_009335 [Peribacillus muralis]|uniref:Uncharacterized protein n=1 Tax=Peribacillus muralis TaxID=264697 RepID=A0A1B3XMW8_9BACI|nr:hypothetical protein ABE28_009335 [Peribacillus muralis]
MENVNWYPLKQTLDVMSLELALILFIPLIVGLIVKFTLARVIRLPNNISNFVSTVVVLLIIYKVVIIVLG